MSGLIHIYSGWGKGKTTAATGLAIRAAGAGKKVIFAQFLKDGTSSEINILNKIDNIKTNFLSSDFKDKEKAGKDLIKLLSGTISEAKENTDLLVLDEIICAIEYKVIPESMLIDFLKSKPLNLEVVLTGRNPSDKLLSMAHYVTRMEKIKHPYDRGIQARYGIEF